MDGRIVAALLGLGVPAVLIGVTIAKFGSNPLSILLLLLLMIGGMVYLLSYKDAF